MYSIRILKPASKELEKLDQSTAKRIAHRIEWLAENLDATKLYPLKEVCVVSTNSVKDRTESSTRSCGVSRPSSFTPLDIVGMSTSNANSRSALTAVCTSA